MDSNTGADLAVEPNQLSEHDRIANLIDTLTYNFNAPYTVVPYTVDATNLPNPLFATAFVQSFYHDHEFTSYDNYCIMMDLAVKTNNLHSLNILWSGIYYYDIANPPLDNHVKLATEFSNLETLKVCFYAFHNYHALDGFDTLEKQDLLTRASNNPHPEILAYINTLPDLIPTCTFTESESETD